MEYFSNRWGRTTALIGIILLGAGAGCGRSVEPVSAPGDAVREKIEHAVADSGRPEDDRARDGNRKPADVLTFFGIAEGMKVADLMAEERIARQRGAHAQAA